MKHTDSKTTGLKSSFELVMERLAAKEGNLTKLTDEQKRKISEIEKQAQAKIAELKIMASSREEPFSEHPKEQEDHIAKEIAKIKDWAEQEKELIRQNKP